MSFRVWLLVGKDYSDPAPPLFGDYIIEPYDGGPIDPPFSKHVQGVYRTENEARCVAAALADHRPGIITTRPLRPYADNHPIAWLVTYIIICHDSGESTYYVEPAWGGLERWNDDRDVMAVFETGDEAEAWAQQKNGPSAKAD
jgi:hypothetical protein